MNYQIIPTSYISLNDLNAALVEHYAGTLDDVSRFNHRLYMPLRNLDPANSLAGQLYSDLVNDCLQKLTPLHNLAIDHKFAQDEECTELLKSYFYQQTHEADFSTWVTDTYTEAVDKLAELIRGEL